MHPTLATLYRLVNQKKAYIVICVGSLPISTAEHRTIVQLILMFLAAHSIQNTTSDK